jgi:hypothetical protein
MARVIDVVLASSSWKCWLERRVRRTNQNKHTIPQGQTTMLSLKNVYSKIIFRKYFRTKYISLGKNNFVEMNLKYFFHSIINILEY